MDNVLNFISNFQSIIVIALSAIVIILFFTIIIQFKAINRLEDRYRKFMRGTDSKSIEELVITYLDRIDKSTEETEYMKKLYKSLDSKLNACIQKYQ